MGTLDKLESLNAICPYFTMFPLSFPKRILARYAAKGDRVLDPFCGRGTTNFAARLLGYESLGVDSSPVAFAITEAKLATASSASIVRAAEKVLESIGEVDAPTGEFWRLAYHRDVLRTLCRLREGLLRDCRSDSRKALRGILLGALHGPLQKTIPGYFSNQCARSYAPKPDYAVGFWRRNRLLAPKIDVIEVVQHRAKRFFGENTPNTSGEVILGDSRDAKVLSSSAGRRRFSWAITSPPYYGMRTYVQDQWLRNWFLGGPHLVDYHSVDQLVHSSPESFSEQLSKVWRNASEISRDGARLVVRFGGIRDRNADPLAVLRSSLSGGDWRITNIFGAGKADRGKRQADLFLSANSDPCEEYDVWARLT